MARVVRLLLVVHTLFMEIEGRAFGLDDLMGGDDDTSIEKSVDQLSRNLQAKLPKKLPVTLGDILDGEDLGEYGNFFEGDLLLPLPKITPSGLLSENNMWPNKNVIYKFAKHVDEKQRAQILEGMKTISRKTCVKFQEISKKDLEGEDYVLIKTNNRGCFTHVGRIGGKQEMNLSDKGCLNEGTIIHELIHSLGFRHEQTRPDRDTYIDINFSNIPSKFKPNFAQSSINAMQILKNPYDYESILHYGAHSFAIDKKVETIRVKVPGKKIGQREKMSEIDIRKIHQLYKCPEK